MRRLCPAFLAVLLLWGMAGHAKALLNENETDVYVGLTTRSTGILHLKTVASDGAPLEGVSIYLKLLPERNEKSAPMLKDGEEAFLGKTDSEGLLKVDPVVFGTYNIIARKNGYYDATSKAVVDKPVILDLELVMSIVYYPPNPPRPKPSTSPTPTPTLSPAPSETPGESQPPVESPAATQPGGGDLPQTGGEGYWGYWVILGLNSILLVVLLVLYRGRKKE